MDVPVTTKTAVIRVELPTTTAISIDQFMMDTSGTQIYSTLFDMTNKSAVDVKVEVESTAALGAATKLVTKKDGAVSSTKAGEAWLAIAAKSGTTAGEEFDDPKTTPSKETIATLTEENANVATFVQGTGATGTTSQTFYLEKGTGAVSNTLLAAGAAAPREYVQLYEAEELTSLDQAGLDVLLKERDVYYAVTATAADKLIVISKGTAHTIDTTNNKYYKVAEKPIDGEADASKAYMYSEVATAGTDGIAAFRYIGILSGAQDSWSEADISKVSIKYDIVGVTADKYADVSTKCTYGLYYEAPPVFAATPQGKITVTGLTAKKNYKSITVNGESIEGGDAEWNMDNYDAAKGGDVEIQLGSTWIDWLTAGDLAGKAVDVVITYTDGTTATVPVTFVK